MDQGKTSIVPMEWVLMLAGVFCAGLATYAKNMALAGVLGTKMKLNPLDTTCYMALPAGLVLLVPALIVSHPMGKWPGFPEMTDWQVVAEVLTRKPLALLPVAFSGVLAFCYNILQYTLVHKLSAAYAAFAGNFNKAAPVALALALGLESLPAGSYGQLFLAAVIGNIAAFTIYSSRKASK